MGQFTVNPPGGAEGDRTPDLVIANDALSHLSYGPVPVRSRHGTKGVTRRARRSLSDKVCRLEALNCRQRPVVAAGPEALAGAAAAPGVAVAEGPIGGKVMVGVVIVGVGTTGVGAPVAR